MKQENEMSDVESTNADAVDPYADIKAIENHLKSKLFRAISSIPMGSEKVAIGELTTVIEKMLIAMEVTRKIAIKNRNDILILDNTRSLTQSQIS
jgi:hypothetical protein